MEADPALLAVKSVQTVQAYLTFLKLGSRSKVTLLLILSTILRSHKHQIIIRDRIHSEKEKWSSERRMFSYIFLNFASYLSRSRQIVDCSNFLLNKEMKNTEFV